MMTENGELKKRGSAHASVNACRVLPGRPEGRAVAKLVHVV